MKKIILLITISFLLIGCNKKFNGKEISFELNNIIVDGYEWSYIIEDNSIIKNNKGFKFISLKEGKTKITFNYFKDKEILYNAIYDLSVDKLGNVRIDNKTGNYFALEQLYKYDYKKLGLPSKISNYLVLIDKNMTIFEDNECYNLGFYIYLDKRKYKITNLLVSKDYHKIYKKIDNNYILVE